MRLAMQTSRRPQVASRVSVAQRGRALPVVRAALLPDASEQLKGCKVLVAGATGRMGKEIVEQLQALGVPTRALVRDVYKADKVLKQGPNLETVRGDVFQYATLPKALGDANVVIVATGAADPLDPLGPFNVDYQGTKNLVSLAAQKGVKKFVLVTSIGTDDLANPLNLFWGVLFWKKRAEEAVQRSGLDYTIVRPGGLKSGLRQGERAGNVVMEPAGHFGVPPSRSEPAGSILRKQVAEVCVAALYESTASDKVVEVVARPDAPERTYAELFGSVA